VPRHVARLVTWLVAPLVVDYSGLVVDYFTSAARPGASARVRLTIGNRPVYRGNRPYRHALVTVPAGYQPLGLGNFEFQFQKLKMWKKIPKNTS
jgi:hypothetical protein